MANSLKELTKKQMVVWDHYYKQGVNPWTADIAIQDLTYQIGSLTKLNLQLKNERFRHDMDDEAIKAKIADEMADIIANTLFAASELGIDMDKAFNNMLDSDIRKITERNPSVKIDLKEAV